MSVWSAPPEDSESILQNLPQEVTPLPPLPPVKEIVSPPLPVSKEGLVPTERPITLEEAIQVAGKNQLNLSRAHVNLEQANATMRMARSLLFPSLSVSYSYQTNPLAGGSFGGGGSFQIPQGESLPPMAPSIQSQAEAGSSQPSFNVESFLPNHSLTLSANQTLFDFGRTWNALSQVKHQREAAEQRLLVVASNVIHQVKQTYYALLQSQRLIDIQRQNLESQQAHLKITRARFEEQVAPYGDVARATAAVADAQIRLVQAQNNVARARISFNLAIGIDPRTPVQVEEGEEQPASTPPVDELVEYAYKQRAEVRQVMEAIESAKAALSSTRKANLPRFVGSASESLRGSKFPPNNNEGSVSLRLEWNPFDFGLTKAQVDQARNRIRDAEMVLELTQQSIAVEVIQAYQDMQVAQQQIENAAVQVASAQESLRISRERYEAGIAAFIEVTDAQTVVVIAQTNQINAKLGLSQAQANLEYALGLSPTQTILR